MGGSLLRGPFKAFSPWPLIAGPSQDDRGTQGQRRGCASDAFGIFGFICHSFVQQSIFAEREYELIRLLRDRAERQRCFIGCLGGGRRGHSSCLFSAYCSVLNGIFGGGGGGGGQGPRGEMMSKYILYI